jgi:8-oxo-dGTP pyrophosphatase MutT (NUDIX family)
MHIPDSDLDIWLAPGGGVEAGESAEDCLTREVFEETGFRIDNHSGPVWIRRHQFLLSGEQYDQREEYYLVRTHRFEADGRMNPALHEAELVKGFRWWSLAAIQASDEIFVPRQLGKYLEQLLCQGCPPTPIDVGI